MTDITQDVALTRRARRELAGAARRDLERRLQARRVQEAGWTAEQYRWAMIVAAGTWMQRWPWRALPRMFGYWAFVVFGRRFATDVISRWADGA